jgi:hypothetical protein
MKKKNLLMTVIAIFGLATITFGQTVPSYIPTSGLVGWWPFNGNANDESGNENNGTVNGANLTSDRFGNSNQAYGFDGVNDFIQTPNQTLTSSVSFSGWYNMSSFNTPGNDMFFVSNQSLSNDIYSANIAFGFRSYQGDYGHSTYVQSPLTGYYATNNLPTTNVWHHIVCVFENGSYVKMYLDTVLVYSNLSVVSNLSTANLPLLFGGTGTSAFYYYFGQLDDIGIWNRALTLQEITDLYNGCQLAVNTQPSSQQLNINNNAQFVVGSSDPNATFQWQTDLGVGFQNLNSVGQYSGTTNDTLTVSNITMSNNNQPFRCIINSGSCSDTSNVAVLTVNNNVGINEFTQDNLFSVFPNPAHSQINIKADATLLGSVYTVYDNTGKVVLSGKINSENTTIELGNLSGGIYLFSVGENLKQTFKVIKE